MRKVFLGVNSWGDGGEEEEEMLENNFIGKLRENWQVKCFKELEIWNYLGWFNNLLIIL